MSAKKKSDKAAKRTGVDFPCPRCGTRIRRTLSSLKKKREACAEGRGYFPCPGACGVEFSSLSLLRTSPGYVATDADATQFIGEMVEDLEAMKHETKKRRRHKQ